MHVELADDLAFERHAETQHAVRGGCCGPMLMTYSSSSNKTLRWRMKLPSAVSSKLGALSFDTSLVMRNGFEPRVVILTQGVPHPVVAQEQAPHVGMVQETDAEIVEASRSLSSAAFHRSQTEGSPHFSRLGVSVRTTTFSPVAVASRW